MTTNANPTSTPRNASQTREAARRSLKSHYWLAVLACLIAALLGAAVAISPTVDFSSSAEEVDNTETSITWEEIVNEPEKWAQFKQDVQAQFAIIPWNVVLAVCAFAMLIALIYRCVGFCVRLGLCRFHLSLTDGEKPTISTLFQYFGQAFWKSVGMNLLRDVILFICQIPALLACLMAFGQLVQGIMAFWQAAVLDQAVLDEVVFSVGLFILLLLISLLLLLLTLPFLLRYVMASYVLAENPEMRALDALRESRRMMTGNKWRYFCLQMSFIGWAILAMITGIGAIFLAPYMEQAYTEFYHEVSGRAAVREMVEETAEICEGL